MPNVDSEIRRERDSKEARMEFYYKMTLSQSARQRLVVVIEQRAVWNSKKCIVYHARVRPIPSQDRSTRIGREGFRAEIRKWFEGSR